MSTAQPVGFASLERRDGSRSDHSHLLVSGPALRRQITQLLVELPLSDEATVAVVAVDVSGVFEGVVPGHLSSRCLAVLDDLVDGYDGVAVVAPCVLATCGIVEGEDGPEALRRHFAGRLLEAMGAEDRERRSSVATGSLPMPRAADDLVQLALGELRGPASASSPAAGASIATPRRLSQLAIRGGSYLVAREGIGMVVRLAGLVLTLRAIGPAGYGIYSGAAAFVLVVTTIAQMGIETYLMRQPGELEARHYNIAFTFLLCTSAVVSVGALGLTFVLGGVLRPVGVLLPLRLLLLSVPINVLWAPAQAAIERRFRYRAMGLIEIGGDVVLYGVAVPLALLGMGAWSLVVGFLALQTWLLVGSYVISGLRLRPAWSAAMVKELFRHGFSFSLSAWIARLGGLVNPLVVGSFAGAVGVGYVAFALRLVDTVGFAQRGAYRLGMVSLGQVPDEHRSRLRYAIEEGSSLQLLALGVPFAGVALVAKFLIPAVFGATWSAAIPVYVLLTLASVLNASGFIQATFLFSRGRNLAVALTAVVASGTLAAVAVFAVHLWGIDGYGVAALAALADLWFFDRATREMVDFSYTKMLPTAVALCPLLFVPLVPFPSTLLLFVPLAIIALVPVLRAEPIRLCKVVEASIRPARAAVS